MESSYKPLQQIPDSLLNQQIFIHVLGGGYSLSDDLPANLQLGSKTLARLIEGIRIHRMLPNSVLVTSGYSAVGLESQAAVARKAAMALGVDSTRIEMLETPSSTWQEAEAFKNKFGNDHTVIVVTDAIHLPRAMTFFKKNQLKAVGAPAMFLVPSLKYERPMKWLPSMRNIELSNIILHEYLGNAKGLFLK